MKNTWEHISFRTTWEKNEKISNLLGQCYAYINSMLNIPIRPDYYQKLLQISLNKGALATTAIEGNTLTQKDLDQIQRGTNLAPSKKYQQQEIENILTAFNTILNTLVKKRTLQIVSPDLIKSFHAMVGKNIGEAFGGGPGRFRRRNVVVGIVYRPPPFDRVEQLIEKFCKWLLKNFHYDHEQSIDEAILEAIVSHVYIAWIHPFEDGNGRTARLLEFYLLMRAGIPGIASHILSDHYNNTRTEYYQQLQKITESGNLTGFIEYALEGFRDGLKEAIDIIFKNQITETTWTNFVHYEIEKMQGSKNQKSLRRLRQLAYYIPADRFLSPDEIRILNPKIAEEYRKLGITTLRRDLNTLVAEKLLKTEKSKYSANYELLNSLFADASVPIRRHY